MSAILTEFIGKLQLDDAPGLASKAAQLFDQLGQRLSGAKGSTLALCRPAAAIQLACEHLSIEFNEAVACSVSSMQPQAYRSCLKEARVLLGVNKHITLEEIDVQFGPPAGIIEYSRKLLDEFRLTLGAAMPVAVCRNMNWGDSAYIAGAFFLVCKHFKKRVVAKAELIAAAAVKPAVFNTAVEKLTQFGKSTLADIDAGRVAAPKTPGKRVRENHPNTDTEATPTPRTRRAAEVAVPDEIGSIAQKRARRTVDAAQPATEPVRRTYTTRGQLGTPPVLNTAQQRPADAQETPVRRKRGRPPMTAVQRAAKEAVKKAAAAASRRKKAAASRLRIGTVTMIKDQDYRTSQQYADYQLWKANVLKA
ncbi:Origin of replication complex subunit 6 [Coemansia biformis]|uniref:Origin of replication complex subunit 6 n=1 Tax=Coemansia biformis TaxID=1286918 RepID=A0A9W7YEX7_9FUNG|nr:Origin of replication complex subunit 6 [Coemansia biformis]